LALIFFANIPDVATSRAALVTVPILLLLLESWRRSPISIAKAPAFGHGIGGEAGRWTKSV
jgi:hypothetical protein